MSKKVIRIVAGIALICGVSWAGGLISYPAKGNLNFSEGTIEMWINLEFEPVQTSENYKVLLPLFQFYEPDIKGNISISYVCLSGGGKACWAVSFDCSGEDIIRIFATPSNWKKDQWHHLALTWKENIAKLYLDGKLVGEAKSNKPIRAEIKKGNIFIGDRWTTETVRTQIVIDELRISSIERKPEDLGFSSVLKVDPYTLLLENFEQIVDGKTTKPAVISGISGEKGGETCNVKLTEGRFGKGLSLF